MIQARLLLSGTVTGTASAITALTGYTAPSIQESSRAIITARTGGIMFTYDGTTPTAAIGHYLGANQNIAVEGRDNIGRLKFIREASTSCDLTITLESD